MHVEESLNEEEKAKLRKAAKKAAKKAKRERENDDAAAVVDEVVDEDDNDADQVSAVPVVHGDAIKDKAMKKKKVKKDKQDKQLEETTGTVLKTKIATTQSMYVEHSITKALTNIEIKAHRDELGIQVFPEEASDLFKPLTSFECLTSSLRSYCPYIMNYIRAKQFSKPSPIQSQCWAPLLSGRDVVGIAATGSGKTLGFLIPGLLRLEYLKSVNKNNLSSNSSSKKPNVPMPKILIVAPTRELAMQSYQVVEDLGGPKGVCIYGGVPKGMQKQSLQGGAEIVVATPGRLMDLIDEHQLSLSQVCYLVLDEADRMLDEGFEPVIRQIISLCPQVASPSDTFEQSLSKRQTVMFSATWPEEIRNLADKFLNHDMIKVTVGSDELSANHRVTQIVECVQAFEKDKKLTHLLETYHKSRKNRILIFVLYKKEAADLQVKLAGKGYNVTAIHGVSAMYTTAYTCHIVQMIIILPYMIITLHLIGQVSA